MDIIDCFEEISEDFGIGIAIGIVQIDTLITSSKPKNSELSGKHSFEKRMRKLSRKYLSDMKKKDFELCWEIIEVLPSWQVGREMFGIGGAMEMKIKDLLKPPKKKIPKDMKKI